jgi:hypothetical protein
MVIQTLTTLLTGLLLALPARAAGENLIKNGTFDRANSDGHPIIWVGDQEGAKEEIGVSHPNYLLQTKTTVVVESEDGNPFPNFFLHTVKASPVVVALGKQTIPLEGKTGTLAVSFRARVTNLAPGSDAEWHLPRLNVVFTLPDGSKKTFGTPSIKNDVPEWRLFRKDFKIPEGAIRVDIALQGIGWTGTFDVDDVVVTHQP